MHAWGTSAAPFREDSKPLRLICFESVIQSHVISVDEALLCHNCFDISVVLNDVCGQVSVFIT